MKKSRDIDIRLHCLLLFFFSLNDVSQILTTRAALLGMFSENSAIQDLLHLNANESRLVEVSSGLASSKILRSHGSLQESLVEMTYLSKLVDPCKSAGLRIEACVNEEIANNMWDRGEILPAIRILQDLDKTSELGSQSIQIGKAGMLATLVSLPCHTSFQNLY